VEIELIRPSDMSPEMVEHWRALQGSRPSWDSPFLRPDWPLAIERALGDEDRGVRVAVLRQAGESTGFIAARVGRFTAMAAGAPLCDYQGLVAAPDVKLNARALVAALGVGRFDFSHMLEDEDAFAPHAQGREISWIVDVAAGYETYAAERRAVGITALKDLDKKRRKAEREAGPALFTAHSDTHADLARLLDWKRERYKATGQIDIFASAWPRRLIDDLFTARNAPLSAGLFTLHIGGELAAAHFHLFGSSTIHAWMIAHDPRFERYSPGLLLFQDILRWMDAAPFSRLDLGYGDYRFKRELANAEQGVTHGFVGVASPASLVRGAAYRVRKAAETLPLGAVSALPGKAMRRLDLMRGLR